MRPRSDPASPDEGPATREPAVPFGLPRWVPWVALVALLVWLFVALQAVLTPLFFAFLIAYGLAPLVDRLEARGMGRSAGSALVLGAFLGGLVIFFLLFVPGLVREVAVVAAELPAKAERLLAAWEPVLRDRGIPVPHSLSEILEQLSEGSEDLAQRAITPLASLVQGLVGGTASVVAAVTGLFIIPVFAYYLLYDFDRMVAAARGLLPPRHRAGVDDAVHEVDAVLGQFVRGQLTVMVVLAVLYAIGYSVAGVRLAVPIGLLAGLLSFIPYAGSILALGLALLMCALNYQGFDQLVLVVVIHFGIQTLEGFVITPKIVGDSVGLGSFWVLLALMVASELFGFLGVLLALPAAAVIKIGVVRGLARYRASAFFGPDDDDPGPRPRGPPPADDAAPSEADAEAGASPNASAASEAAAEDEGATPEASAPVAAGASAD